MARLWLICALLIACSEDTGGKSSGPDGSGGGEGGGEGGGDGGGTGGDDEVDPIYPTGTRVLLYNGHGGHPGDSTSKGKFENVDTRWKELFDWNTDVRDVWPDNLPEYRMMGLIAPGYSDDEAFTAEEVALLEAAMEYGTRLVIFADRESCNSAEVDALLGDLGFSIRFTGDAMDENRVITTDDINTQHQVTTGTAELKFKEPCYVDPSGGTALIEDTYNNVIAAAERVGSGGDLVLLGDFQFMDDGGYLDTGDNARLADNLVVIEP